MLQLIINAGLIINKKIFGMSMKIIFTYFLSIISEAPFVNTLKVPLGSLTIVLIHFLTELNV